MAQVTHMHSVAVDPAANHQRALQPPPPSTDSNSSSSVYMFGAWRVLMLTCSSMLLVLLGPLLAWHVYLIVQVRNKGQLLCVIGYVIS